MVKNTNRHLLICRLVELESSALLLKTYSTHKYLIVATTPPFQQETAFIT